MKKLIVVGIVALMVLTLAYVPGVSAANLSDVSGTQFEKQINALVDAGVIAGFPDGTFKPLDPVTRAQFAKLVAVAMNLSSTGFTQSTFSDVAPDHWALGFIEAAVAKGWILGYPDGTFGPEKNITREEMATLMIRVLGREEQAKPYTEAFVMANDCAKVSDWAFGAVTLAYHTDVQVLTLHQGQIIDPQTAATREETANAVYFGMKPPVQGGNITIGMTQEPSKMYVYQNNMAAKAMVLNCVLDGWINVVPEGTDVTQKGVYVPVFAQEVPSLENGLVKFNDDGTMDVTWHLRKTPVYWSDGVQVTLDDAIFGHNVLINMAIPADVRDPEDAVTTIEKIDANTLHVVYSTEKSAALYGPAFSLAAHKYEDLVNTNPEGFFRSDINTYPLGHGAYVISSWSVGSSMTLTAREDYHFGPPNIKTLTWLFIPDASTIYARIASGDLDMTIPGVGVATTTAIDNLNSVPGLVYEIHPSTYVEHIELNMMNFEGKKHPIFNDPNDPVAASKVRHALAYALNTKEASDTLYKGYEPPAYSMIPPAVAVCFATKEEIGLDLIPGYNPDKAKQLLDEAGWTVGGDGIREKNGVKLEFQLSTTNRTDRQQMASIWQSNLADVGIKVNLDFKPGTVFFNDNWAGYKRGYPDAIEFAWGSTDPRYPVTDVLRGDRVATVDNPQGQNYAGWQNSDYDVQAQIIQDSFDLAKAKEAAVKSQQILLTDMPVIPLVFTADAAIYKTRIQGVKDPNWSSITWNVAFWYLGD
jgi:peptide/nickel transport system substrate-binding protein